MGGLKIAKRMEGDVAIISPEGSIDTHTAPDFEAALKELIGGGKTKIVVDLSGVGYISSAGVGVFMSLIDEVKGKGGDIKIASAIDKVYKVFEMLGFTNILSFYNSVDEAVNAF